MEQIFQCPYHFDRSTEPANSTNINENFSLLVRGSVTRGGHHSEVRIVVNHDRLVPTELLSDLLSVATVTTSHRLTASFSTTLKRDATKPLIGGLVD